MKLDSSNQYNNLKHSLLEPKPQPQPSTSFLFSSGSSIINFFKKQSEQYIRIEQFNLFDRQKEYFFGFLTKCDQVEGTDLLRNLKILLKREFVKIGLYELLICLITFAGPIFQEYINDYYQNQKDDLLSFMCVSLTMILLLIIQCFLQTYQSWENSQMQLKMKMFLQNMIFKKSLELTAGKQEEQGEIVNLISIDIENMLNYTISMHSTWSAILKLTLGLVLLYLKMQYSVLIGILVGIILIFMNIKIARLIGSNYHKLLKIKDQRLNLTKDILKGIKQIKYLNQESLFENKIQQIRKTELKQLSRIKYLDSLCVFFWAITNILISGVTFIIYMKQNGDLREQNIFMVISIFNILVFPLNALPWTVAGIKIAKLSFTRIDQYCQYKPKYKQNIDNHQQSIINNLQQTSNSNQKYVLEIKNMIASYESFQLQAGHEQQLQQLFSTRINDLKIENGSLNIVIGPLGSGKSLFLRSLLNECHSSYELLKFPTNSVSYTPQNHFLMNDSILNNITFGNGFEKNKFWEILKVCELEHEIKQFDRKEHQEVGIDGGKLSGGQKARVCIARALYQNSQVYLMDDILSSLDRSVARNVFNNLIQYLKNRTLIMVVSNTEFLQNLKLNDRSLNYMFFQDNQINQSQQSIQKYLGFEIHPYQIGGIQNQQIDQDNHLSDSIKIINNEVSCQQDSLVPIAFSDIRLNDNEEDEQECGQIKFGVVSFYYKPQNIMFVLTVVLLTTSQAARNFYDLWLKSYIESNPIIEIRDFQTTMIVILCSTVIICLLRAFVFAISNLRSANSIFNKLLSSVIYSKQQFFDQTSTGRILTRFSNDSNILDDGIPFHSNILFNNMLIVVGNLTIIVLQIPLIVVFSLFVLLVFYFLQKKYRKGSRQIKRMDSNYSGQFIQLVQECSQGLEVIRAFNKQKFMVSRFNARQIKLIVSNYVLNLIQVWFQLRLSIISVMFSVFIISYSLLQVYLGLTGLFYIDNYSLVLALTYSLQISNQLKDLVISLAQTEKEFIGIERIMQFSKLPQEQVHKLVPISNDYCQTIDRDRPVVEFDRVSFSYDCKSLALDQVCFKIYQNQKIGFIGRTGSGKSSILNILFKLYDIEQGRVILRGKDLRQYEDNLQGIRSQISVVPQSGFLFEGTVVQNLDPSNQIGRQKVAKLIEYVKNQLVQLDFEYNLDFLRLDQKIDHNGNNLSNGQKQVLNLLRALLEERDIICLDEATSNIDELADNVIQNILKSFNDKTIIMVTHRIKHIKNFDYILVMKDGKVVERGNYQQLMAQGTYFNQLVKE